MSPEAQRIAIAEACGWTPFESTLTFGRPAWTRPGGGVFCFLNELPDYLNDLNAMHEAEKGLKETQWTDYLNQLYHITFLPGAKDRDRQAIHSTAAQRAEAFLHAIGKWKEAA